MAEKRIQVMFDDIRADIENHPSNAWAKKLGYKPVYTASEHSRIVIIGQAPGRRAQESHIPWNDVSGEKLREWLSLTSEEFYDDTKVALIPMDFYFPGSRRDSSEKSAHSKPSEKRRVALSAVNISSDMFPSEKSIPASLLNDFDSHRIPRESRRHGDKPPRKEFADMWHPKLFEHMPNLKLTILVGQYSQKYYLGKSMKKNLTETVRSYDEYLPKYLPLVHSSPLNFRWQSKNPWFKEEVIPEAKRLVRQILQS